MFAAGPNWTDDEKSWEGDGMVVVRAKSLAEAKQSRAGSDAQKRCAKVYRATMVRQRRYDCGASELLQRHFRNDLGGELQALRRHSAMSALPPEIFWRLRLRGQPNHILAPSGEFFACFKRMHPMQTIAECRIADSPPLQPDSIARSSRKRISPSLLR